MFDESIEELNTMFFLTLDRYKKAYIQNAKNETSETKNILSQAEGALNNVFKELILLKANIGSRVNANKNTIVAGDEQITVAEESWNQSKSTLRNQRDMNLAAKPLKHDTNLQKNETYLTSIFYVIGIVAIGALIVKQFQTNKIPSPISIPIARAIV
jgi:hypothetical protein